MKNGTPYIAFAVEFRAFLKKKKYASPSDFHRDLVAHMKKEAPSKSAVWAAFYGVRALPLEVVLFMVDRYGFEIDWRNVLPVRDLDGAILKSNQLSLPGMREMRP